jgi:hypothetical protein
VLDIATKKGVLKLSARISRVFTAMAKQLVMLCSRISVAVDCGGILFVDGWTISVFKLQGIGFYWLLTIS